LKDDYEIVEKDGILIARPREGSKPDFEERFLRAGIPPAFLDRDFKNFMLNPDYPSLARARAAVEKFAELYPAVNGGLLIMGPTGVGKTHLAVALCKTLLMKGAHCIFVDFRDSMREYTSYPNQDRREDYLHYLGSAEVLIWDDFASRSLSDWEEDFLYRLIDKRYREGATTVLTTVHQGESLERVIGVRLRSRLYEMCREVEITAPDYRSKVRRLSYRKGGKFEEDKEG